MTAEALKKAALDHLAEERVAAFSFPLGDDLFVCAGTKEEIAKLVAPEGWKLVPVEPTPEMQVAGFMSGIDGVVHDNESRIYRAMIAATPPQAKEEE